METTTCDATGLLRCGDGSLEKVKDIYIVHLRGTYEEMGRQHAALATEACGALAFHYMGGLIEKLVAHAVPLISRPAGFALKRWFLGRNRARLSDEIRAHLRAFAEGLGVKLSQAEAVFLVPDILHYLAGRSMTPLAFPPMCSGFFAFGGATRDGKLLLGRNFDFFGRGVWNDSNALIVMHPKNAQRICWIGALGASVSAQGFNESGLVFSLHTKFCRDVSSAGTPLFSLCHDIMAHCTTLDEAIGRFRGDARMCGLTVFLVDTRARKAACVEFSAKHHQVVSPENDVLVRTNHYTTERMRPYGIAPHPWQRNSHARLRRIQELLEAHRGTLAPEDLPVILSDCLDPYEERTRVTGSIVAGLNTTQSFAMSPDDDSIWVAKADHPVCHSDRYAGFRLSALLEGDRDRYSCDDLRGAQQLDPIQRSALREYVQAWTEHFDNSNSDAALFHLRRAHHLLPEEAIFPRMAGLLLMKKHQYEQALPLLVENTRYEYKDALMQCEAYLWAGRCLDLMGRRSEAKAQYERANALNVAVLSESACRHLQKPFGRRELLHVSPEFVVGTAIARYRVK